METREEKPHVEVRIAPLSGGELATEIAGGVGRALGLTLFWVSKLSAIRIFACSIG